MKLVARALVLISFVVASCGPSSRPSAPSISRTSDEAPQDGWEVTSLPPFGGRAEGLTRPVERDATGEMFVVERLRFHAREEGVDIASDVPRAPIVATAHADECWLFATADGILFRAPSFSGPLTQIGVTGGEHGRELERQVSATRSEALLVSTLDDFVWLARCDGTFERFEMGTILGAAWLSPDVGVLVRAPGEVLRTRGGSWEPVAMLADRWTGVRRQGANVLVRTSAGGLSISATGAPVPISSEEPRESDRLLGDAGILARLALRLGSEDLITEPSTFTHDGTLAVLSRPDIEPLRVLYRRPDGSSGSMPMPELVQDCELRSIGSDLLAHCLPLVEGGQRTFRAPVGQRWESIEIPAPDHYPYPARGVPFFAHRRGPAVVTSDDGGFFQPFFSEGREQEDSPGQWYDGRAVHARRIDGWVRALHGDLALVVRDSLGPPRYREGSSDPPRSTATMQVFAAHLSEGEEPTLSPLALEGRAFDAVLVGDTVIALVARADETLALATGAIDALTTGPSVPPGVTQIEFADVRHGVALTGERAFLTRDGGAHWEPLPEPLGQLGERVFCRPHVCRVGTMLFAGPRVLASIPRRHRVRGQRPEEAPHEDSDTEEPEQSAAWACSFDGAQARALGRRTYVRAQAQGWPVFAHQGWLEPLRADGVLRWAGRDARGSFRARARAHPSAAPLERAWMQVLWLTRERAVVERCVEQPPEPDVVMLESRWAGCEIWLAEPDRAPVHLASDVIGAAWVAVTALALPDGSVALQLTSEHAPADLLLHVGRDGTILGRRVMTWSPEATDRIVGLVADRDGLALAYVTPERTLRYALDPSRPPVELPALGAALPSCGAETGETTILVRRWPGDVELESNGELTEVTGDPITRIELGAGGACWREIIQLRARPSDAARIGLPGTVWLSAENGRPRAELMSAEGHLRGTCTENLGAE